MKNVFTALFLMLYVLGFSQIEFSELSHLISGQPQFNSIGMAVIDVNSDYRDDIIAFNKDYQLEIAYQQAPGEPFLIRPVSHDRLTRVESILVTDHPDYPGKVIIATSIDKILILTAPEGSLDYSQERTYNIGGFYAQGANAMDFNKDGITDLFFCNDVGENVLFYLNSGVELEEADIDFSTAIASNNSGNYGSVWADFDGDNDLDLYVAKCSVNAPDDPTDPRRINQLFINDNGHLALAEEGIWSDGAQSWSVDAADINNDGWVDLFYTNHDGLHKLLYNSENGFAASAITFEGDNSTQNIIADFDNNGFQDILVTSLTRSYIYFNDNGVFEKVDLLFSGSLRTNATIGDLNHDGFLDIYGSSFTTTQSVGSKNKVLINRGNDNHYVRFHLADDNQSLLAGTKIYVKTQDKTQLREAKFGTSYGITTSAALHFGLGQEDEITEVKIIWPDGIEEIYEVEEVDADYVVKKGNCLAKNHNLIDVIDRCEGQELLLDAGQEEVVWNSGLEDQYSAYEVDQLMNFAKGNACGEMVKQYVVKPRDYAANPILSSDSYALCHGETLDIPMIYEGAYQLNGVDQSEVINITEAGSYELSFTDVCGAAQNLEFEVYTPEIEVDFIDTMFIYSDSLVVLHASGEVSWYEDPAQEPISTSDALEYYFTQDTTVIYLQKSELTYSESIVVGRDFPEEPRQENPDFNTGMYFNVLEPMFLESIQMFTEKAGHRKFLIMDGQGTVLQERIAKLNPGINTVDFGLFLDIGDGYYICTDENYNLQTLGTKGPLLSYEIISDMPIMNKTAGIDLMYTDKGTRRYSFFYNWKVKHIEYDCDSELWPIHVIKKMGTAVDDEDISLRIYPNPTTGRIQISSDYPIERIEVTDQQGRLIWQGNDHHVMVQQPGLYFIRVYGSQFVTVKKVVVR